MTLIEMVKKFDSVPVRFTFPDGSVFELFVRRKTNNKGYLATIWLMKDNVAERMVYSADGQTAELAKENLKNYILES